MKNVSHDFGGRSILEDVSFRLLKGNHVGFVGANGDGKSTFMSIITGNLMPDKGEIIWASKVRVGYMDQHTVLEKGTTVREALKKAFSYLFEAENELNQIYEKMADADEQQLQKLMDESGNIQDFLDINNFYMIDPKVEEVARGLGLLEIGLDKDVFDLSGGQRTKILLGKLLLQNPDVLLLDEPTNFLDEDQIIWLKNYLINYENAFILISHDVNFLNDTVNLIYHLENATLTRYVGDYDEFVRLYELSKKQIESAYERQQSEIANLQDFISRNKARVATAGMAKSRQKVLDKMDKIELAREKPKPEFRFLQARTPDKIIFKTNDLVIGYEEPLSKPINLLIERGKKIVLVGTNGIGKSTLLKSLLDIIPSISGDITVGDNQFVGYFEQEIKETNYKTCIDDVWEVFPAFTQQEIRRALAKCGLTTEQIESKVYVLSGGEQAKVRLCKIMNTQTNILLLDEPTNHLDQDAKNALSKALIDYTGTILMVCHEPDFYENIVDTVLDCKEFSLKI